jgi:hypothetical protein
MRLEATCAASESLTADRGFLLARDIIIVPIKDSRNDFNLEESDTDDKHYHFIPYSNCLNFLDIPNGRFNREKHQRFYSG